MPGVELTVLLRGRPRNEGDLAARLIRNLHYDRRTFDLGIMGIEDRVAKPVDPPNIGFVWLARG